MMARYGLRRGAAGVCLATKTRRRLGFLLGFLVLLGAAVAGFDPTADLQPSRLPLTLLYLALLLSSLGGALSSQIVLAAPGELRFERRCAGLRIGLRRCPVEDGAEVRLSRLSAERTGYALEVGPPGNATPVDASSWKSELEPMGRELAAALGVPFRAAEK